MVKPCANQGVFVQAIQKASELLEVSLQAELLAISKDPEGGRALELAQLLRHHPEGGVDLVVSCIKELASLLKKEPFEDAILAETVSNM